MLDGYAIGNTSTCHKCYKLKKLRIENTNYYLHQSCFSIERLNPLVRSVNGRGGGTDLKLRTYFMDDKKKKKSIIR